MLNLHATSKLVVLIFLLTQCSLEEVDSNEISPDDEVNPTLNAWYVDEKTIQGTTQGTTFLIKTSEDSLRVTPQEISDLLAAFDLELSGYIDLSILSQLNQSENDFEIKGDRFFTRCYELSRQVYEATDGAFDPTVFPLVKAWGFFKDMQRVPSDQEIDSLLTFVSFKEGLHHVFQEGVFKKKHPSFQLDFNAIAQGQSADVLGEFLIQRGHSNYFIEVGGEITVKGLNNESRPWIIGIDVPEEDNDGGKLRTLENYLSISEGGIATSGNYRKFYEKDGKKYSHTLDPKTGYPVQHNLLSATVIAENAALADAYATAFMTMGADNTMTFLEERPELNLEVYLLYATPAGRIARLYTPGMKQYFLD